MRDTFVLLWVGFLIVGVIGSIVSSIRKQAQQAQPPPDPRRMRQQVVVRPSPLLRTVSPVPPPPAAAPPRPAPPPPRPAPPRPAAPAVELAHDFPTSRPPRRPVFGSRKAIVQAVIAAEVLGKPRGLRDEYS